jgi:hypothetical protein
MRKVLLSEDVSEDIIGDYIARGFKPYFLSKRKIRKKDKKVWNKIQRYHLDPAVHVLFGKQRGQDWDEVNISGDPILDKLLMMGSVKSGQVIKSQQIDSMQQALEFEESIKDIELRFVTVKTYYRYALRDDVPPAKSGSRPFCEKMMETKDKLYTFAEIQSLSNNMKDVDDVFLYRGGFYTNPNTGETTPFCRHRWIVEVRIER